MTNGSEGRLATDSVSNIGPHYARTLREWKRRFTANFEAVIAPALRKQYDLSDCDLEIFRRKWICESRICFCGVGPFVSTVCLLAGLQIICEWYFFSAVLCKVIQLSKHLSDYCEAGFATRSLGDHIITFTREGNVALGCTWDDYHKV